MVHLLLVLALREAVVVLDGGDGYDGAGAVDLLHRDVGDTNVADLAGVSGLLDGAEALLERCLGVDAVQVVQRDGVPRSRCRLSPIGPFTTSGRPIPRA